jgi:hypothetical protein
MATVKLNSDGKVITKDGNVSCDCCSSNICGGCEAFYQLTEATSINVSFVSNGIDPASEIFSMIEPYTSFDYSEGERTFYGGSGACGVNFGWYFTEYPLAYITQMGFEIFKKNNICMLRISSYTYGAPGADYTFYSNGFIEVRISKIFGTHDILETGERCQIIYDDPPYTICNPISQTKTVTIL